MSTLESKRQLLRETAANIGLACVDEADQAAVNFSASFDAGRESREQAEDGGSISGPSPHGGGNSPSDDWGDAAGFEVHQDDELSVSLSLPGSFEDFKVQAGYGNGEDDASASSYEHGRSKSAPFDLATGVPAGMVAQMQQQIASLLAETRGLDAKLSEERLSKAAALAEAENLRQANERSLQMTASELKASNDRLKAMLMDQKNAFRDLDVSEATYEELRHASESDLSLREFVCLQVYGQRLQLKQEIEESRRDAQAAAEARQQADHANEAEKRDMQRAAVASAQREEGLRLELESAKRWADDLRARLDRSERKCLQLEPKGREHGELSERCARSEAQLLSSQAQVAAQQESLTEAQASARSATARVGDLEHAVGYLEMDKGYLQKEVEKAYNRSDRAERAVEACQEKLREAETSKEQLGAALEQLRNESRAAYDDRIGSELARARAATAAELSSIREGLGSVHRRECETLREARDLALAEAERCREQLGALRAEYDHTTKTAAAEYSAAEHRCAELRSELKVKAFEHTSLVSAHEGKTAEIADLTLHVEALKKQVAAHEVAFRTLEDSSSEAEQKWKLQLEEKCRALEVYDGLEIELDAAVMRAAGNEEALALMGGGEKGGGLGSERRMRQAVFLAKQLLEKERALEAQTAVLEKARSEAANQRARIAELEHHVSCAVSQPSRMVLGELERSEAEVVRLKGSLEEAVARADEYATALREAQEAREDAENDLASVLDKQGELRQMVEALQHQQQQEQREQEHQQREQQQRLSNLRGPPSPHTFYRHGIPPGSPQFHTRSSPAR